MREKDRQTARARAQVQRPAHGVRIRDPRGEPVIEDVGDVRARHDDALIDVEAELAEPRFVCQVGRRDSVAHTPLQHVEHGIDFHR